MNASKATQQGSPFYVGTYTEPGKSKGIYACSLNVESGDLTLHSLVAEVPNPTWVTFSPNGKFLYSTQEVQDYAIRAFRIEGDGSLTALNSEFSKGNVGCHLLVDATGKNILTANYSSGSVDVVRLEEDGSLGKRTAFIKLTDAGPDPIRQTQSYAHGVFEDFENARIYVCDLGLDFIWIYNFDSEKGTLTPNTTPAGQVVPGSGPRHLARHSTGKFFYVNGEMGINITVFECNPADGALKSIQVLSTLPEGASGTGVTSAEVCLHPCERWLYVSNRGHD
ncbi:MAG: lactonase family protein, partial [Chthoniobacterales bacterium]